MSDIISVLCESLEGISILNKGISSELGISIFLPDKELTRSVLQNFDQGCLFSMLSGFGWKAECSCKARDGYREGTAGELEEYLQFVLA